MQPQIEDANVKRQAEIWREDAEMLGGAPAVRFRLTTFPDRKALAKTEHPPTTLHALAREIPKKVARTKGHLPYLKLAIFGDKRLIPFPRRSTRRPWPVSSA